MIKIVARKHQIVFFLVLSLGLLATFLQSQAHGNDTNSVRPLDLLELNDLENMSVSPNGRYIFVQERQAQLDQNGYRRENLLFDRSRGDKLVSRWSAGDTRFWYYKNVPTSFDPPFNAQWSPDSEWIYYLARKGRTTQVWRKQTEGSRIERIGDNEEEVLSFNLAQNGRLIYINRSNRLALQERRDEEALRGYLFDDRWMPFVRDRPFLPTEEQQSEHSILFVYDLKSGQERPATEADQHKMAADVSLISIPRRAKAMFPVSSNGVITYGWAEPLDPQKQGVFAPLTVIAKLSSSDDLIVCELEECSGQIKGLWLNPDNNEIVFYRAEGEGNNRTGVKAFYSWSPNEGRVKTLYRGHTRFQSAFQPCHKADTVLICFEESAIQPARLVSFDLVAGGTHVIYEPNDHFKSRELAPAKKIIIPTDFDGVTAFGWLMKPTQFEAGKKYPLIITTYRPGGFLRGNIGDEYPAQVFAANGFVVLSLDVPEERSVFERNQDMATNTIETRKDVRNMKMVLSSIHNAIDEIDRRGWIDTEKVGIAGLSYGAETTHYAIWNSERFSAAIASGPTFDPIMYFLGNDTLNRKEFLALIGLGNPLIDSERGQFWKEVSPAVNAEKIQTPLLLNVADQEYLLSLQTFQTLRDLRKPVEMHVFPDEFHHKWQPAHRYNIYRRNLQWLQFWLQGKEVEDPVDPEQYERWRELRKLRDEDAAPVN